MGLTTFHNLSFSVSQILEPVATPTGKFSDCRRGHRGTGRPESRTQSLLRLIETVFCTLRIERKVVVPNLAVFFLNLWRHFAGSAPKALVCWLQNYGLGLASVALR